MQKKTSKRFQNKMHLNVLKSIYFISLWPDINELMWNQLLKNWKKKTLLSSFCFCFSTFKEEKKCRHRLLQSKQTKKKRKKLLQTNNRLYLWRVNWIIIDKMNRFEKTSPLCMSFVRSRTCFHRSHISFVVVFCFALLSFFFLFVSCNLLLSTCTLRLFVVRYLIVNSALIRSTSYLRECAVVLVLRSFAEWEN